VKNTLTLTKSGSGTIATASASTTDTIGFHHVVATKSGPTVKLYIDGIDRTDTVTNRTVGKASTALNLGRNIDGWGRLTVPPRGGVHVDDLPLLVDGSVQVNPPAGDFHVGLVHKPTVAHPVPGAPRRPAAG
jgi:hypothetical protein